MALVTVALVTIIALAALSIDIGTLYQAKAEAQRAADAAALTAARMISISGITGDPTQRKQFMADDLWRNQQPRHSGRDQRGSTKSDQRCRGHQR